jgi:hypothetical protein
MLAPFWHASADLSGFGAWLRLTALHIQSKEGNTCFQVHEERVELLKFNVLLNYIRHGIA